MPHEVFYSSFFFFQVLGALWYLLSVDRQTACWKKTCRNEANCDIKFLDCDATPNPIWANATNVFSDCNASDDSIKFDFGMFQPALANQAPAQSFAMKYFYSLWWGLQNLRYFLSRNAHILRLHIECQLKTYLTLLFHRPLLNNTVWIEYFDTNHFLSFVSHRILLLYLLLKVHC